MTDQERKDRILMKMRNIVFLVLGLTVAFLSIQSMSQAVGMTSIMTNLIWLILALIIIVQAIISIVKSFRVLKTKQRIFLLIDWLIIGLGICLANIGYLIHVNLWLIIGIAVFIAGCIPIEDKK